jgi:hypothetical protein
MSKKTNHGISEPERTPWGQLFLLVAIVGFVFITATACPPRMIEMNGHRVFNPEYLWYLESENRDEWQKPDRVIEALELSEGDVIADMYMPLMFRVL